MPPPLLLEVEESSPGKEGGREGGRGEKLVRCIRLFEGQKTGNEGYCT